MMVLFLIQLDHFTGEKTDTQKYKTMLSVSGNTRNQIQVSLDPESTFFTTLWGMPVILVSNIDQHPDVGKSVKWT